MGLTVLPTIGLVAIEVHAVDRRVGAALGQYGGVWAHDETRKSFGIAGPRVVEGLELSLPTQTLDGKHPRESAEVVARLRDIVGKLVAEIG